MVPAKRGEMVAFEKSHSYTSISDGTVRYSTFHLGEVDRASRDGVVKAIRPNKGSYVPVRVDRGVTVYTISAERQAQARALFAGAVYPGLEFESAAALRDAVLAA